MRSFVTSLATVALASLLNPASVQAAPVPGPTAAPSDLSHLLARGEAAGDGAVITGWVRPDRVKFDGEAAPFVVPDAVTWFKIGEDASGTTIAGQQIKQITDYLGKQQTATIGDVLVYKEGVVAEAIGSIMPDGQRGELYNIIACNVQKADGNGKCIMVDYNGRDVSSTVSKIISGSTSTIPLAAATAAPAGLSEWAAHVMVVQVKTVEK